MEVKIKLKIKDIEIELTKEEARELQEILMGIPIYTDPYPWPWPKWTVTYDTNSTLNPNTNYITYTIVNKS